jgi:hypothetical protein
LSLERQALIEKIKRRRIADCVDDEPTKELDKPIGAKFLGNVFRCVGKKNGRGACNKNPKEHEQTPKVNKKLVGLLRNADRQNSEKDH